MQTQIQEIETYLAAQFKKPIKYRAAAGNFRFNIEELRDNDLTALSYLSTNLTAVEVKVKRSGTGLAIIINCK